MRRRLFAAVALVAVVLVRDTVAQDGQDPARGTAWKAGSAPFQVQTIEKLVLSDARRGKDLPLRIHHPDDPGPFPLVIFSHGAFGSKDNYLALTGFWCSHGYVTIQPTHSDSRALGIRPGDPNAFRDWQSRPADVSFILDSLETIESQAPALKGKLARDRIGVGGHSFGANTAQLIGGARAFPRGGPAKSFADARVAAVLLMSGQGPGEMLTDKSWADFTRPMLVMTGSRDGPTRTGQPAEWRKQPYELSPPGDKYLAWIEDLDHGFGGITGANFSGRNKPNADHVGYTKIVTLAFWDAYLSRSPDARAWLESDKLPADSQGAVTLQHK
jgi:predicted dienelactone hydrolase